MSEIQCFWIDPGDRARVSLRRYKGGSTCAASGTGYHNAHALLEDCAASIAERPEHPDWGKVWNIAVKDRDIPHDDPRWPKACACGFAFAEADNWQVFTDPVYKRIDNGTEMTLRDAPPGAMYDAWWLRGMKYKDRGDGIVLMVLCPDQCHGGTYAWNVDGPSSNGNGWERSGIAKSATPTVTANPSIGCGEGMRCYHGWLRNGTLVSV